MELLAPFGGHSRALKTVLDAGPDAIYFGVRPLKIETGRLSLLHSGVEFDLPEAMAMIDRIHDAGRRAYVTLNSYYTDNQLPDVLEVVARLCRAGLDALIVTDPGLLAELARLPKPPEVHLSVLGRCTNPAAAAWWREWGVRRLILDRTMTIEQIRAMTSTGLETEVFVYGGNCFNHHGLCRLSSYFYGEMCFAPCANRYAIAGLPAAGPTPFRSLTLNAYEALPALIDAGVTALKIEGRQKAPAATAQVVRIFRRALDALSHNRPLPEPPRALHFRRPPRRAWPGVYLDEDAEEQSISREQGLSDLLRQLTHYLAPASLRYIYNRERRVRRAHADRRAR